MNTRYKLNSNILASILTVLAYPFRRDPKKILLIRFPAGVLTTEDFFENGRMLTKMLGKHYKVMNILDETVNRIEVEIVQTTLYETAALAELQMKVEKCFNSKNATFG